MESRYLFRGKRTDNGEWEIGSLIALPDGKFEIANKCENPPDGDPMWRKCVITHYVDPSTICQYTGLKDKNGKLIWENDIVSFAHKKYATDTLVFAEHKYTRNYVIEFENTFCNYGLRFRNKSIHFQCTQATLCTHDCEVMGNVFDNPELLEV